jgi:WD40 repeat protein
MWDLFDDRVPVKTLESHSDKVTSMEISTMGNVLASASVDGKVNLWKNLPKAD